MKLFNAVKAGVSGRIAKICAKDGEMVEYQQTLFLVEEAGKLDEAKRESA
jgi:biotin carboxyl carrier protein